jgi:hypothetical protein
VLDQYWWSLSLSFQRITTFCSPLISLKLPGWRFGLRTVMRRDETSGHESNARFFKSLRINRAAVLPVQMRPFIERQESEAKGFLDVPQQWLVALVLRHQFDGLDRQRAVWRDVLDLGSLTASSCGRGFDRP